jgi:hypothetical protein
MTILRKHSLTKLSLKTSLSMFKVGLVLVAFYLTLASEMTVMFVNSFIYFWNTDMQHKYQT